MWVMERVDGTDSSVFSGIYSELCGLWSELKVQRTGCIMVYRENCVVYGASYRYREQGVLCYIH